MPDAQAPDRNPSGFSGLRESLAGFAASVTQYFRARLQLARLEAAEAFTAWAKLLLCVVAALLLIGLSYLGFVAGLIAWVISTGKLATHWVILIVALLHLVGAILLLLIAKYRFAVPGFQQSLEELKRDQDWMTPAPKSKSAK